MKFICALILVLLIIACFHEAIVALAVVGLALGAIGVLLYLVR